jgi:lipid A 3-O-deacylase
MATSSLWYDCRPLITAILLTCAAAGTSTLNAQVYSRGQNGFWALYWENDTFYDTDQSYTNGARIAQVRGLSQTGDIWWLPDSLLRRAFGPSCVDDDQQCWEWSGGWTIGQQMYTPRDIRETSVITDDRPYGGWTYIPVRA